MSKIERTLWLWGLAGLGAAALSSAILPAGMIILSYYLIVGFLLIFSLPLFIYAVAIFGLNLALLPVPVLKIAWVRLPLSGLAVLLAAHAIGGQLNTAPRAEYARLAALDIPASPPSPVTRLVFIDDRTQSHLPDQPVKCDVQCVGYLYNAKAQAVLYAADPDDRTAIDRRRYLVFTGTPHCEPVKTFTDVTDRIWKGACLHPPAPGPLQAGDLVVRRADLDVPSLPPHCDCQHESTEVYRMTASGLKLVARQTSFDIQSYGDWPMLLRNVSWSGMTHDDGLGLKNGVLHHWRFYEDVVKKDLGLDADEYLMAARQPAASRSPKS